MIKSLVDQGRLEYLRSRGMEGRVVGYVEPTTSPENRLLVARASKTPQTVTVTVRNARARDAIRGERSEAARRG